MKNHMIVITILALALSGCSPSSAAPAQTADSTDPAGATAAEAAPAAGDTKPGDQQPQGKRLRGQIQDVLGNEVTLALIEAPKRPEGETTVKPKTTGGDPMGGPPMGGGQSASVKLTGETQVIQIPVGVPIVSRSKTGEAALQLSDLGTGDIITVLYDADGTTILKVNVSSGGAQ